VSLSCTLPKVYYIGTDNGDQDVYYLSAPDGEVLASGEDTDELFMVGWAHYRKKRVHIDEPLG
jgi:hypothetical protein